MYIPSEKRRQICYAKVVSVISSEDARVVGFKYMISQQRAVLYQVSFLLLPPTQYKTADQIYL